MAKRILKCKYCGQQFDANVESFVDVGGRRYAHEKCANNYQANLTQEEKDEMAFYDYAKNLFKDTYNYMATKKLAEQYIKEYNYSYSGMLKSLIWFYDTKKNSIEKAKGTIGIIPYVYNDVRDYYLRLYMAQMVNNVDEIQNYQPEIVEIEIASPRMRTSPIKLFHFNDEEWEVK